MDTIPLLPDFLDLLRFLNEERVEYLVIGGMAVNYYGYHRSTGDLDLWVAITPENQNRLAAALEKFGFSAQSVARRPLLEETKFIRIPFISLRDLRRNKLAAGRTKDRADLESLPDDSESKG